MLFLLETFANNPTFSDWPFSIENCVYIFLLVHLNPCFDVLCSEECQSRKPLVCNCIFKGLIKIRGDKCWRDLTCMNYHYQVSVLNFAYLSLIYNGIMSQNTFWVLETEINGFEVNMSVFGYLLLQSQS